MKTTNQKTQKHTLGDSANQPAMSKEQTQSSPAQPPAEPSKDHRLPIDSEARKQNRTLPTPKVLNLLLNSLPDAYRVVAIEHNN